MATLAFNELIVSLKIWQESCFLMILTCFFSQWYKDCILKRKEWTKKSERFNDNNISWNERKSKFALFHRPRDKDNVPLQFENFKINEPETKSSSSTNIFGVLLKENLAWEDQCKNIGKLTVDKFRINVKKKKLFECKRQGYSALFFDTCGALRDLVPFVQFKKRGKRPWRSVNFSKVAG